MNIKDFIINKRSGKLISFNDASLPNLESLLNGQLRNNDTAEYFLEHLRFLKDNWSNTAVRDAYIQKELVGYWEEDYLHEENLSPGWFSFLSYIDIEGYMHNSEQKVYLLNDLISDAPIVEMSLDDFIDVIEQWKNV